MNPSSPTQPSITEDQQKALDLITSSQRILLTGHVRPDGDCIGAQAALVSVLRHLGREVIVLNTDPPEESFDYLSERVDYRCWSEGDPVPEHDLTVLLDCSELSRCAGLGDVLAGLPTAKLIIDHHIHQGEAWWDAAFQDSACSATGLLVRRIARALGAPLDEQQALGVFTSMVTDTGWFKYSNTDVETLATAAELVEFGLEPHRLYQSIYQRRPLGLPADIAAVLGDCSYHADGRLAVVQLPLDDGGRPSEIESDEVLDILRSVRCVEVVLFLRQVDAATCKLSARSKNDFDVQVLASRFGGGGHAKAAGATLEGTLEDCKQRLVESVLGDLEGAGQ